MVNYEVRKAEIKDLVLKDAAYDANLRILLDRSKSSKNEMLNVEKTFERLVKY